eukprot:TRINITY_DN5355_c0_g1_i1.p1 TRINITY_DN5355_c0_g1~~TRINITY_DN5355_c0_g1_i1.p1  ORF type:complete len:1037 (+),score=228.27 TRINITY_DN5355_c0_g1_i1:140-3250(+)
MASSGVDGLQDTAQRSPLAQSDGADYNELSGSGTYSEVGEMPSDEGLVEIHALVRTNSYARLRRKTKALRTSSHGNNGEGESDDSDVSDESDEGSGSDELDESGSDDGDEDEDDSDYMHLYITIPHNSDEHLTPFISQLIPRNAGLANADQQVTSSPRAAAAVAISASRPTNTLEETLDIMRLSRTLESARSDVMKMIRQADLEVRQAKRDQEGSRVRDAQRLFQEKETEEAKKEPSSAQKEVKRLKHARRLQRQKSEEKINQIFKRHVALDNERKRDKDIMETTGQRPITPRTIRKASLPRRWVMAEIKKEQAQQALLSSEHPKPHKATTSASTTTSTTKAITNTAPQVSKQPTLAMLKDAVAISAASTFKVSATPVEIPEDPLGAILGLDVLKTQTDDRPAVTQQQQDNKNDVTVEIRVATQLPVADGVRAKEDEETKIENQTVAPPSAAMAPIAMGGATGYDYFLQAVTAQAAVDAIDFTGLGCGDDKIIEFVHRLPTPENLLADKSITLTTLVLDGNDIERSGAKALAAFLSVDSCLLTLSLKWNMLGIDGAEFLAEALRQNTTLASLQLEGNSIEAEGAEALGDALKHNIALTDLNLKENSISDSGAKSLADVLYTNGSLACLDLTCNSIGADGGSALAAALMSNTGLHWLVLNENFLGDDGAKAMGEALKTNSVLYSVDLRDNCIADEGFLAIIEGLKENKMVSDMDLTMNRPGIAGEIAIMDLAQRVNELEITWRDQMAVAMWDESEIKQIIDHYGVKTIFERFLKGGNLEPLVADHQLLEHLHVEDMAVANYLLDSILVEDSKELILGIDLLLKLVQRISDYESSLLCSALVLRLDSFLDILCDPSKLVIKGLTEGTTKPFGSGRLRILELFTALFKSNYAEFLQQLISLEVFSRSLALATQNPLNNFVHRRVMELFETALQLDDQQVTAAVLGTDIIPKTMALIKEERHKPVGDRQGYTGHFIQLANRLPKITHNLDLLDTLNESDDWQAFVEEDLYELNEIMTKWPFPNPQRTSKPKLQLRRNTEI